MIKKVPSFKDSAGTLHESQLLALIAEQKIELRGIIQGGPGGVQIKNGTLSVMDAVAIMIENGSQIAERCRYYRQAIKREREKGAAAK